MSDNDEKKPLSLGGKLSLKAPVGAPGGAKVQQSFSGGRTKAVTVEVKRRRGPEAAAGNAPVDGLSRGTASVAPTSHITPRQEAKAPTGDVDINLSDRETEARAAALARAQEQLKSGAMNRTPAAVRPQVVERPKYDTPPPNRNHERGDRPQGDRPSYGDRAPRGDRPPYGDRPQGDRPQGNRPYGDRPQGDRPQGNRPYGDRPQGDRPQGNRPYGDRPQGDRPQGNRPYGDRPQGNRPYGDRPYGDRPQGDRPQGDRGPRPQSSLPRRSDGVGQRVQRPGGFAPRTGMMSAPMPIPEGETRNMDHRSHHERKDEDDKKKSANTAHTPRSTRDNAEEENRKMARLTVTQALNEDYEKATTGPSLSSIRRARQKQRFAPQQDTVKQAREVILPETITVQELANRMAERSGNVVKSLMKMGVMATINQSIDADTAELLIIEYGHKVKRVTEADVEIGMEGEADAPETLKPRAPVVTIMGHVDHGKTSLLDALRKTDVVSGEAGGITQHIGAYQITSPQGAKITFLDTPGHAAFTEMRARGANITDIVVLVVAANDGIMPQTIEAIQHAKAAGVPIVVACNKIDTPEANPQKVKTDLLQYEVVVEDMGGDVQFVEVSAKKQINLDKLEDAIMVQAEILELKANPDRDAVGRVVESKLDTGRGSVATILIQRGTLKVGDIFVAGAEWGRVRALHNDKGEQLKQAGPSLPVEILGLQGTPEAGDEFVVVEDESKARKISEFRSRKRREKMTTMAPTSIDNFFAQVKEGQKKELALVVKADVHGSLEAILGSVAKLSGEQDEVNVRVLLSGVGAITETDIALAKASNATILGFNVRANAQARVAAEKDKVSVKYYNIIYQILDDLKGLISGLFAPITRENLIGYAQIRQVFNITKVGKIAGCMVTEGFVKRGAKVRLLRDDVVIHEGTLKTLKRFKDEVKEVKEGMECGMAFENYDDIREGDMIECFDVITEKKEMA